MFDIQASDLSRTEEQATSREAVAVGSVLRRCSVPMLHAAACLLRLLEMHKQRFEHVQLEARSAPRPVSDPSVRNKPSANAKRARLPQSSLPDPPADRPYALLGFSPALYIFIRTLIEKKFSLPRRVLDALSDFFSRCALLTSDVLLIY